MDCKPKYLYEFPMFMITVHTVIIEDNGVLVTKGNNNKYDFAGGVVRAGQESIIFSALRHIKEQTGILVKKNELFPVDFRSEPERSPHGNIVDLGFVVSLDRHVDSNKVYRLPVDFENKQVILADNEYLSFENQIFFERALDVVLMMK